MVPTTTPPTKTASTSPGPVLVSWLGEAAAGVWLLPEAVEVLLALLVGCGLPPCGVTVTDWPAAPVLAVDDGIGLAGSLALSE